MFIAAFVAGLAVQLGAKGARKPNLEFGEIFTQGGGMAERNRMQARQARDELRQIVGFSAADELAKLERLKSEKAISDQEYARLRARVVQ